MGLVLLLDYMGLMAVGLEESSGLHLGGLAGDLTEGSEEGVDYEEEEADSVVGVGWESGVVDGVVQCYHPGSLGYLVGVQTALELLRVMGVYWYTIHTHR